MIFDPNQLFYTMLDIYNDNKHLDDKVVICNEGGSRCFEGSQLVVTKRGNVKISDVKIGDEVLTYNEATRQNEYKRVIETLKFDNTKKCVKVTLKNGHTIIATEDHEFYNKGVWIELRHMLRYDSEFLKNVDNFEPVSLDTVYDLSIEDNHNYYIHPGKDILVHNSSKTWDFFHLLVLICDHNRNAKLEIYVLRETLSNCRDFTFAEFKKCLHKMGVWDDKKCKTSPKPQYDLFGNDVMFRGLDDSAEGYPSDIAFVNEALENQNKEKIDGIRMRCRMLFVMDWNPKYARHWAFELEGQPNTHFTHSNYTNNKHLEKSIIKEIESYNPENMDNILNGTADDYRWKVYGLGQRAAPEGIIFQHVNYIDEFPKDVAPIHGLDFGFTADPSALVRVGETRYDLFLELLMYDSTENSEVLDQYAKLNTIDKSILCIADSSDKYTGENKGTVEMVRDLKRKGWNIQKVKKDKSVMFWIAKMRAKKIHIIKNKLVHHARVEQENYRMKTVNGMAINQPVDKHNHFWDASRYGFIALNQSGGIDPKGKWF